MKRFDGNLHSARPLRSVLIFVLSIGLLFSIYPSRTSANDEEFLAIGDVITFGHYEQDNQAGNGSEPIRWIVLMKEDVKTFLISESILDVKPYDDSCRDVTWENCSLRAWLNGEFLCTAFSMEEQVAIRTATVINDNNPQSVIKGGHTTYDKVFLLSIMGIDYHFIGEESRQASSTPYADARGLPADDWWLRSPGEAQKAAFVSSLGHVSNSGVCVDFEYIGVRPVIVVDTDQLNGNLDKQQ